jgi:two-component system, LuxR family, response regulator FixJ
VLQGIVAGKQNKVISAELNISLKTVEAHRASVMKKMRVKSVPELVKLVLTNGVQEPVSEE